MPVSVKEYVKVKDLEGTEHEGVAVATNLSAIEVDGSIVYGIVTSMVKVRTKVVCDNEHCINSEVDDQFKTSPRVIEFDDSGDPSPDFIRKIAEIVIASNYRGEKMAFCTPECAAHYMKKAHKSNVVTGNFGKGPREVIVSSEEK